jgi:heat shock protein HslJ
MHKLVITFILIFTAILLGCNTDKNSDKKTEQSENQPKETIRQEQLQMELNNTYWKLISLQGKQVPMPEDQKEAHIILKSEGQKVTGSGGCNVLNGTYELGDNNSISFSKMATTMMSCPDMETEQQFLKVFETADVYRVKGDTLLLSDSDEKILAKFVSIPASDKSK